MPSKTLSRRRFIHGTAATAIAANPLLRAAAEGTLHQATGTRVGEITDTSAIVWTRLTKHAQRNNEGIVFAGKGNRKKDAAVTVPVEQIEGACPGMAGSVRLRYGLKEDLSDAIESPWVEVTEATDFIHHFDLKDLKADATYYYASQTRDDAGSVHPEFRGQFFTAPQPQSPSQFNFCVMTCQGYPDRDHVDGHPIYPSMLALKPKFVTMTGDLVYYDSNAPRAVSPALARLHWERMFSLPRIVEMMRNAGSYWLKDDHDTVDNDCYPGMNAGELSFAEGIEIFHQQAPLGKEAYRTFRWGRDLQIWFTEGVETFDPPNKMADGPDKTIWGAEQKAWFKRTVAESDATWKLLISPTPLVGPDRANKHDNHSNDNFAHEGNELREWIKANVPDNFFVVCGDRHWQYHSVHPTTGVQEFSVGAASDSHAGGTPGEDKTIHRYHRVKGGFLNVALKREAAESVIAFQLRDVDGVVGYEAKFRRAVG